MSETSGRELLQKLLKGELATRNHRLDIRENVRASFACWSNAFFTNMAIRQTSRRRLRRPCLNGLRFCRPAGKAN